MKWVEVRPSLCKKASNVKLRYFFVQGEGVFSHFAGGGIVETLLLRLLNLNGIDRLKSLHQPFHQELQMLNVRYTLNSPFLAAHCPTCFLFTVT
jgi:hypothetical protein